MLKIAKVILLIPRPIKRIVLVTTDSIAVICALWISFSLSMDDLYWPHENIAQSVSFLMLLAPVIALLIFPLFGFYRTIIRHLGMKSTWLIIKGVAVYAALWGLAFFLTRVEGIPRSVVLINAMVGVLAIAGPRMVARSFLRKIENFSRIDRGELDENIRIFHQS